MVFFFRPISTEIFIKYSSNVVANQHPSIDIENLIEDIDVANTAEEKILVNEETKVVDKTVVASKDIEVSIETIYDN